MPFPLGDRDIRIGILGYTEGNGHPYSWGAMFNGYDREVMASCPLPAIPAYLSKQPPENFGVPGARVTCVCCTGFEGRERAEDIARASLIPEVVDDPREMIGRVDAVIVATDVGSEHAARCRPFIEAGIPLFIDKPMVDNEEDLRTFVRWRKDGARFLTSSAMRYAREYVPYHKNHYALGRLMHITSVAPNSYEKYGIHALEAMYPFLGEGFVSVRNTGTFEQSFVHIKHASGCNVHISTAFGQMVFGVLLTGSAGSKYLQCTDSYYAFRTQLQRFVHWLRNGEEPFPFGESVELMKLVIAGIRSRDEGGREVFLSEIKAE